MKAEIQNRVVACLQSGKYRVDSDTGRVETYVKSLGLWRELSPVDNNGTLYYKVSNNKRGKLAITVRVPARELIWISQCGPHRETEKICFRDGNPKNLCLANLVARDCTTQRHKDDTGAAGGLKADAIKRIRILRARGISVSEIARMVKKNRSSVSYVVNQMKKMKPLRFENWTGKKMDAPFECAKLTDNQEVFYMPGETVEMEVHNNVGNNVLQSPLL